MKTKHVVYVILVVTIIEKWGAAAEEPPDKKTTTDAPPDKKTITETPPDGETTTAVSGTAPDMTEAVTRTTVSITYKTWTTTTRKSRRKKTRVRRSSTPSFTTKFKTKKKEPTYDNTHIIEFTMKLRAFYCMKLSLCTNDNLYFERSKKRVCALHYASGQDAWFDHLCTMWLANCQGQGMFYERPIARCEHLGVTRFYNIDYIDPPRTILFQKHY